MTTELLVIFPFLLDPSFQLYAGLVFLLLLWWLAWRWFTRPKYFFLVRHGESLLNAQHIRQGPKGRLSPRGRLQALKTGEALTQFRIQKIIASPYERTQETAVFINESLHVPIESSSLLAERRNATEVIGRRTDDPLVVRISDAIDHAYHDDTFRYSDEENFLELKTRAQACLRLCARRGARRTCLVTHGFFLKMLVAVMLYDNELHARDYAKLTFFNAADNARVTICKYEPRKRFSRTRGWSVLEYNTQLWDPAEIEERLAQSGEASPEIPGPSAV